MAKRKNRKVVVRKNYTADSKRKVNKVVKANRKYKDTVFRMLFSDRNNLLSLYNAVNGSNYEDPDALEIVTLENAVYMGMKNDLAFIVDTGLFLYEHQSTYNPNMPLRDLFYISGEYQKLVNHKSLYSSALQKIPAPNFIVFYNGTERDEDYWINYLSESYENQTGGPNLELKVLTLNINEGHNCELMEQYQILREYAQYVAKVRENAREADLDTAVEQAVNDCIQNGILAEFLRKNKSEVITMSIFEYDKEEEERKLREAEYEAGYNSGRRDGYSSGRQDGLNLGIAEGKREIIRLMYNAGEYDVAVIGAGHRCSAPVSGLRRCCPGRVRATGRSRSACGRTLRGSPRVALGRSSFRAASPLSGAVHSTRSVPAEPSGRAWRSSIRGPRVRPVAEFCVCRTKGSKTPILITRC